MKKIINTLLIFIISISVLGQAPQYFNYQAVLRDNSGEPMASEEVDVKIDILIGSATGTQVFTETHETETNEFGLVNIKVGSESSLAGIDWSADDYFIRVSVDGTVMGATQLLSVPYALHAGTADESDPLFAASPAASLDDADIDNWDEAYLWGDHAEEGYLTDEDDPVFAASPAAGIDGDDIASWDEAYLWGDHAEEGYLTDEDDPVFAASPAAGIDGDDIASWDEAYLWGDHAAEGYLTEELDPLFALSPAAGIDVADIANWDEAYLWGDHSEEGYLTEEEDPLFSAWDKSTGIIINEAQISDLKPYLTEIPAGNEPGEIKYWNGSSWVPVEPGEYHHQLHFCNGVPTWGPCPPKVPVVTTMAVTEIEENEAKGGGNVINEGSQPVTEYGLVWGESEKPTVDVNDGIETVVANIDGPFNFDITGLIGETTYYVRAYAINDEGIAYGNQVEFTTDAATVFLATVTTAEITDIDKTTATSGGDVTADGGSAVTARGIVWSKSTLPTTEVNDGQLPDGDGGLGAFVSGMTALDPNTNYYVRAYAINSVGTAYGNQRFFATLHDAELPTVTTAPITDITQTTATGGGNVTSAGDGAILLRGVCWSTSPNPTLSNSYTSDGNELGEFTSSITGLAPGTTYYVRAFASNSFGVAFGNQVELTTEAGPPVVEIVSRNAGNPGFRVIDANVTSSGGEDVTARGIVWSTEENPELDVDNFTTEGDGIGEFSSVLTEAELTVNTTYYIRAYAENIEGIGYSEQRVIHFWDYNDIVTYDGYQYNTVMIGDQEWMTENLRTTIYSNSVPMQGNLSGADWSINTEGAYALHSSTYEPYGFLYNWHAVNNLNGLCPAGWKVASRDDYIELVDFVESIFDDGNPGNKLKSCRMVSSPVGGACVTSQHPRWPSNDSHYGTDEFGFSAHMSGGYRDPEGNYFNPHITSGYWTDTEFSESNARRIFFGSSSGTVSTTSNADKSNGHSVRCIRDSE